MIQKIPQSENLEIHRDFLLPNIESKRLEEILSDIKKQKSFQILGYILISIIIGYFIIKKPNDEIIVLGYFLILIIFGYFKLKILDLTRNKDELTKRVINELETSNKEIKNILNYLICADTYLIYSDRTGVLSKLEEYKLILFRLKQKKEIFEKYFNDIVETSINEVNISLNTIENFNKNLIERRKKEYDILFKRSNTDLNDEQKTAIITDDKHNLVVAGAGSGKTEVLITRIAYLVLRKQEKISSGRILALAFQNKAGKEIEERLNKKFGIEVKIKTFHSFGYEILSKPKLKFDTDNEYNKFISELYKKAEKEPIFQNKLLDYMLHFGDEEVIKHESDFKTKNEWYQYIQNLTYTTLDGTKVKSEGERTIFNFLFTHKINERYINFRYEHPAEWMNYKTEKDEIKTPRPDFFLPEYNIYIEHWAIDEKGNVPKWFDQDYNKGMNAKKEKFKQQDKYSLIETSYGEYKKNDFIDGFKNKLIKDIKRKYPDKDFVFNEMGYSEIVKRVWLNCKESMERNPKDIANFITKAKTNGLTSEKILERLEKEVWSPKQKAFAELALIIYFEYEKELKSTNQIDFSDMINQAIVELETNELLYENSFDHILIDEYQDISKQRYRLIKALMAKNPNCKLFCVGDDWQSIMGFSGSNLNYFIKFQDYFDHPARTDLSINYRSIKSIVDTGAELIKYNGDGQLKKQTIANNNQEKKIFVFSYQHKNTLTYHQQIAEHCVNMIKEYQMNGYSPQDIMILYRSRKIQLLNRIKEYADFNNVNIKFDSKSPHHSPLMTVHKSKGLQAKIVFILSVDRGLYGFPSEIEDPFIFEPAMDIKITNKEEEERRLFYVAITRSKEDVIIYTQKDNESMFLDEIQKYIEVIEL